MLYEAHLKGFTMRHPHVLQLIVDSLRYWVADMHVDGFRFDLAASLARQFRSLDDDRTIRDGVAA